MQTLSKNVIADFSTQLAVKMAVGATTGTLASATDSDGVALPTGTYFLTLDKNNSKKEYIKCTLTGTVLTDIQSISRQGALTSGTAREHRVGANVIISDFAGLSKINDVLTGVTSFDSGTPLGYDGTATISTANQFATKAYVDAVDATTDGIISTLDAQNVKLTGDQTISSGVKTFVVSPIVPTPTTSTQAVNKSYADGLAIAGSPDSSTTVKGIGQASVAPVSPTTPIFVGDNDPRVPTQNENDALVGTGTPSSSNKYVTQDTLTAKVKFGGTGADGALTISSGTTTVDLGSAAIVTKNYTSISITGTGKLAFSNPHANGTIIILKCSGDVTLTSSAGACIDASGMGSAAGAAGSGSATATSATAARTSFMFNTIPANTANAASTPPLPLTGSSNITNIKTLLSAPGLGGGGGGQYTASSDGQGGAGGSSLITAGSNGNGGGGNTGGTTSGAGGRGGGALIIECAGSYTNTTATLSTAGLAGTAAGSSGSGGGGGGGAGTMYVLYNTLVSDTGTYTVAGGAAGAGSGGGNHAGGAGAASYSYIGLNNDFV